MLPAKPGAHAGAAPPHWRSSAGADWGARARRRQPLGQGWRRAHITGRSEALCGRDAGKRSALWLLGPQACQLQTAGQAQVGLRDCLRTQTLGWRTIRRGMTLTQGGAAPGIRITGAMTTLSGKDRLATPALRMPRVAIASSGASGMVQAPTMLVLAPAVRARGDLTTKMRPRTHAKSTCSMNTLIPRSRRPKHRDKSKRNPLSKKAAKAGQ